LFPHYVLKTITGAGHWVHAEAPDDFTEIAQSFLKD
jgi:esterase